jgi:hypothetical protein
MTVDWHLLVAFPPLHRLDVALEERGDFLPGIETVGIGSRLEGHQGTTNAP